MKSQVSKPFDWVGWMGFVCLFLLTLWTFEAGWEHWSYLACATAGWVSSYVFRKEENA